MTQKRKLKIVCVNDQIFPLRETDTEQISLMIAALGKNQATVELLLPCKWFQQGVSAEEIAAYYEVSASFNVKTLKSVYPSHRGLEKLAHGFFTIFTEAFKDADVVYTRNLPHVLTALQFTQKPIVYETYRLWSKNTPLLQPMLRWMVKHPRLVGVVTHSELAGRDLKGLGLAEERLLVALNGYDPQRMLPVWKKSDARKALGLPQNKRIVTYTGHVSLEKGLHQMLTLAEDLNDVLFIIVGSYGRGEVERRAESLPNVSIVGWKPFREMTPYLYASDVLFIPPTRGPLEKVGNTVLPLKLFWYMSAGRPTLGPANPDVMEILKDGQNAVLVKPDNHLACRTALEELLGNPEEIERLGAQAAIDVAPYTYDNRAKRFLEFVKKRLHAMNRGASCF